MRNKCRLNRYEFSSENQNESETTYKTTQFALFENTIKLYNGYVQILAGMNFSSLGQNLTEKIREVQGGNTKYLQKMNEYYQAWVVSLIQCIYIYIFTIYIIIIIIITIIIIIIIITLDTIYISTYLLHLIFSCVLESPTLGAWSSSPEWSGCDTLVWQPPGRDGIPGSL